MKREREQMSGSEKRQREREERWKPNDESFPKRRCYRVLSVELKSRQGAREANGPHQVQHRTALALGDAKRPKLEGKENDFYFRDFKKTKHSYSFSKNFFFFFNFSLNNKKKT